MKICILDAQTVGKDIDLTVFKQCGTLTIYPLTAPDEVAERIEDADVVITNKVILNEENLKKAHQLKMIALFATGYNNIDITYAKQKGIAVTNVAGYSTDSVAQHTFGMLLYVVEHLAAYDRYMKQRAGGAQEFMYIPWPYHELKGQRLGIIGLGDIGKKVAEIAEAFGMEICYYSTSGKNNSGTGYTRLSLEELLRTCDVISIHAPYNAQTKDLIGYMEFKQMKPSAILLNLGRGGIVIEKDLVRALNEHLIAGAALDVLEKEPIEAGHILFDVNDKSRLLLTPHIGWASVEARNRLMQEIIKNIEAYKLGEQRNRVV